MKYVAMLTTLRFSNAENPVLFAEKALFSHLSMSSKRRARAEIWEGAISSMASAGAV